MSNNNITRSLKLAGILAGLAALSACTSIGYRCPLDATDSPEEVTACASMSEAMAGSKKGTGSKTSVLMDEKGRLIPPELLSKTPVRPLANQAKGPYRDKTGSPAFIQPKVFQVYTESFQDGNGNLHDGHHSYFSTPGRWAYGTMDRNTDVSAHVMGPSRPSDRPDGRIVVVDPRTGLVMNPQQQGAQQTRPTPPSAAAQAAAVNTAAGASQSMSTQQRERAALQNLSNAANSAAANANAANRQIQAQGQPNWPGAAPGVTAPAVQLGN